MTDNFMRKEQFVVYHGMIENVPLIYALLRTYEYK